MEFSDFVTAEFVEKGVAGEHLTEREKHLIGIAVVATRGCIMCSTGRIQKAAESGIGREVIVAAVDLAASVNAGVTVATALQGAQRARLDEICESGACGPPDSGNGHNS